MVVEFELLDENDNTIKKAEMGEKEPLLIKTPSIIEGLKKSDYIEMFKYLNDSIDVLIPYNNGEDFIIQYASFYTSEFVGVDSEILFNKSYIQSFPLLKKIDFIKIIQEVYKTGKTRKLSLLYYIDELLIGKFNETITKINNKIYIIINVESDFNLVYNGGLDMFYNSPDPLMIVQDKKIVKANKAIEKITGYKIEEIIGKDYYFNNPRFNNKPTPEDVHNIYSDIKNRETFNYTDILTFNHKNGEKIYTKATMQPSSFNNSPAVLFYCFDITEGVKHEQEAKRLNDALLMVSGISKIAYMYWDKKNGFEWSDQFFDIIEEKRENLKNNDDIIHHYIIDEDFEEIRDNVFKTMQDGSSCLMQTQIITRHGIKDIELYIDSEINEKGELIKSVGYIQDISKKIDEEKQLKYLLDEKETLIKEVHHRVKNNLQIILSLLNLDTRYNSDNPEKTIESTKNRINSMALIHEKIYQSKDHSHVNIKEYMEDSIQSILINNKNIKNNIQLDFDMDEIHIGMSKAIPLGLIFSEIVNNSFNYAFPNNEDGIITIVLKQKNDGSINLIIGDNGIGLPSDVNLEKPTDLGLMVIVSLVHQIEGTIKLLPVEGTVYELNF
jgi:PAS domain S-box-containing protein